MGEWKEYKLGEIISLGNGKVRPKEIGNIPIYGGNGILGYCNNYNYKGETIIIGRVGAYCGSVYYENRPIWISDNALAVKPKNGYSTKFLYYFLKTLRLHEYAEGSSHPLLTQTLLNTIDVLFTNNIQEQNHIASILGSLDDKIDLLHRENETLEAMAETLFRKWFIENTESSVKQGYLGDYILDTIGGEWGKEVSQDDFVKPVKCIRGTDIAALNTGIPSKTPLRFIKKSKHEKIKPLDGDIIIEISGGTESQSTGRSLYINKEVCGLFDYPIIFSNFCRLLRVEKKYSYFVYCYLQYLYRQDEFFNIENGSSGIKNLDYKTLLYNNQYQMPTNKNFAANFSEIVTPYFTKIDKNKLQICNLMKMRDTLLPRLIFNKIKI